MFAAAESLGYDGHSAGNVIGLGELICEIDRLRWVSAGEVPEDGFSQERLRCLKCDLAEEIVLISGVGG